MVVINELIGNFGKYHLFLCFMVMISKFGVAFHQMAIIFLAPPPHYQCPGSNTTCCLQPIYDQAIFTRTIITEWHLICERAWLKDFTQTVFQFGVLLGSLLFGIASDKYGRKPTLIISVVVEVFSGVIASFLPDFWSFTIVRMILGLSVGGVMVIGFVLIMEYIGSDHRNLVSAIYHIPFTAGYIIIALYGYLIRDYMYFQLAISLSNVVLLFYICLLPESPRWLLAMNKTVQTIALLESVAKWNGHPIEHIRDKIEVHQLKYIREKKGSVIDLFRTPNLRKNILVMSFIWLVCSYCFYGISHYISHLAGDVYINVMAGGTVCLCGCIVAIPIMKYMNRKSLVITGNLLCSMCLLFIAFVPEGKISIFLGILGVLFSYMVFVVVYLYCSEMFPTVVRNAAIGISSMSARFGAMIAPFIAGFRPYGQWCAPVAFGVLPLTAALLCTLLPETKNCELMTTIEEGEAFGKKPRRSDASSIS